MIAYNKATEVTGAMQLLLMDFPQMLTMAKKFTIWGCKRCLGPILAANSRNASPLRLRLDPRRKGYRVVDSAGKVCEMKQKLPSNVQQFSFCTVDTRQRMRHSQPTSAYPYWQFACGA